MTESNREIARQASADDVAESLAERLLRRIHELQAEQRIVQLCLTGGRIALKAYQRLAADGPAAPIDWSRVELWWGDERWVPADDAERNDKQVLDVIGDVLPLDPTRIHRMPASDAGADLDAAAQAYANELGESTFDICLLGMGPDGHVASLFPDHPFTDAPSTVIAVRQSPKPPPERISLTLPVINASAEVWFCVSGADKADAAEGALAGNQQLPAAHVHGTDLTLWLIDAAANPAEL